MSSKQPPPKTVPEADLTAVPQAARTPPRAVEVVAADLEGPGVVFCPNPKMFLWSNHPRVFIDVARTGEGRCSYCGTVYRLKPGEHVRGGH